MSTKNQRECTKRIIEEQNTSTNIFIESPNEICEQILGLELCYFEILTGDDAYCSDEEIYMDFQGKEMRIYIDDRGKLCIYTD